MKRKIKNIIVLLLLIVVSVGMINYPSKAGGAVYVSVSSSSVKVGDSVSVSVSVSAGTSAYTLYVTYDAAVLKYNSVSGGTGNGGSGTVILSGTDDKTFTISFTAIGNGTAGLYTSGDFIDYVTEEAISVSYGSASVTVGSKEDKPASATTEADTRSSNNYLSSLSVNKGTLEPAFDPSVTSYKLRLEETETSVEVTAYPSDSKAKVGLSGGSDLKPGVNTITVTVTAENQNARNYVIKALVGDVLEEEIITVDGVDYNLVTDSSELEDKEDFTIPEGYEQSTSKYSKWEILSFKSKSGIALVCLKDADGNLGWFRYDEETEAFSKYVEFSMSANRYVLLNIPQDAANLEGYTLTELTIGETTITALVGEELGENYYIIYAANVMGDKGFYLYDAVENTMVRFALSTATDAVEEATFTDATATDVIDTDDSSEKVLTKTQFIIAAAVAGSLILILLIVLIVFGVKIHRMKQYDGYEEYDENDEYDEYPEETDEKAEDEGTVEESEALEDEEETEAAENAKEAEEAEAVEEAADSVEEAEAVEEAAEVKAADSVEEVKAAEEAETPVAAAPRKKHSSFEISDAEENIDIQLQSEAEKEQFENIAKEIEEKINTDYDASQDSAF